MQILLNGESRIIPENSTAQTLLESLGIQAKRLAMEVNLEIVPRSLFSQTALQSGDKVEIVQAIGGG